MNKYEPLRKFLTSSPKQVGEYLLSFKQIESILCDKLPPAASEHRPWWGNEKSTDRSQAKSWMGAGFLVTKVSLSNQWVHFKR